MLSLLRLAPLVLPQQGTPLRLVLREDFDEAGTSWASTLFPDEIIAGGAAFTREALSPALGAPDTSPPLPINAGGDLEGRYAEVTLSGGSYALTADVPANQVRDFALRGFVAIGAPDPFGGQGVGFLLRASLDPHPPFGTGLNAYTADIARNGGQSTATLALARWREGVITPAEVFAIASFPVDLGQENYLLEFRVVGEALSARLWRVSVSAGNVVATPIPLGSGPTGPTNVLSARDPELQSGRAGVSAFARGGNSIFFDDIELGRPRDRLPPTAMPPKPPTPLRFPRPRP